ncbi:MAG: cation-translocating P-type ATPase [Oscillospiraceae bacterium]|nr:cation-translocating P-type ATPase [Oscillospiraceae bacterium]
MADLAVTESGLSQAEAADRLAKYGPNKLKEGEKESLISKFLHQLADPMTIILIVAAVISGITAAYSGEGFADVIIILAVVIINAVLGVYQESKAEAAIEALQEIAAATSKVIRDGHQLTIKSEELVPGDIIVLEAGDSVPADARIIESASMKIEEAALTGESVPVTKHADVLEAEANGEVPLGDRKNMVYMGSTVAYGRGRAVVTGTGMETEMGKIADALTNAKEEETPLQIKLNELSKLLSLLVIGICVVIFAVDIFRNFSTGLSGEMLLDTFMVAVSLAVAAIPEGLSAVVTILLSIGVTKMSSNQAIIRKLTAVETLGCTQIICSDKTGTLTQNKMTVVERFTEDKNLHLTAMALCSDAELEDGQAVGEPTECALVNDANKEGLAKDMLKADYPRVGEAPFDSGRKMMSTVHADPQGGFIQFTKGAPDEVLKCCTKAYIDGRIVEMTDDVKYTILGANKQMADKALRVLCSAYRKYETQPASNEAADLEQDMIYLGLSGMIDPIRPEVKDAIVECNSAGIRAVMITGDHKDTAVAIANQLGILGEGQEAITGAQLNEMSDEELAENIEKYSVYARVQPEHKVRIVSAWKEKGKITAMTGDGVNDAPSIKTADIGVGMGITGTDVTKNVADMVLADDNFATIVSAVAEGRRIYDNIRKAIQFLLSANIAEVISVFTATLMGFTILEPVHLLWINLITDCFPAIALGMEKAEADSMQQPPRDSKDGIFAGGMGFDIGLQGLIISVLTLASYFIGHYIESGVWEIANSADGMTMAFLTLSMVEIFHSFNMRSRRGSIFRMNSSNKFLWLSFIVSLICTVGVINVPVLRAAFKFEHISLLEYGVAMILAVSIVPIMEITKAIQRKMGK